MKRKILPLLVCLGATVFGTSTAYGDAFEGLSMMRMGAWEVDFSGNVNAFVMNGSCEGDAVAHGWACSGEDDYNDVRDGLLPSWLNFSAATETDDGWRTAVHISFQPGSNTASGLTEGLDGALGQSSVNFRQTFLTLSRDDVGTFKIGRDLGVFGSDAILNDMTLLGVGSGASNPDGHTTLGRIGVGYPYADWKAQVQYISPSMNGFQLTAALVQPWGAGSLAGTWDVDGDNGTVGGGTDDDKAYSLTHASCEPTPDMACSANNQEKDRFGLEAKINYNAEFDGGSFGAWVSYIQQDVDFKWPVKKDSDTDPSNISSEADGYDIGTKIAFGNFDLVGYYYDGDGIGTSSFLLDGLDLDGEERESDGYYVQARWRMPMGTLLGVSVGESNLDATAWDREQLKGDNAATFNLVESNESWIVGIYHPVGEALNLVVEYTDTESQAHNGNEANEESLAVGAIMFF